MRAGTQLASSYNGRMNRSVPSVLSGAAIPVPAACVRRGRCVLRRFAVAGLFGLLLSGAVFAASGLDELERVVRTSCECAAQQRSGIDAAIRCTRGPRAFGRVKVLNRDAWNDAQRAQAAVLEQVFETCLSGAMDADTARASLGLAPASGAPPLVRWREVDAGDLGAHRTHLMRIVHSQGTSVKGLVEAVVDGTITLRQARRDGGGARQIPLHAIEGAWVMELPR